MLISGLRVFSRSCDLLTADEPFGLTPDFIATASRISLRIHQQEKEEYTQCAAPIGRSGLLAAGLSVFQCPLFPVDPRLSEVSAQSIPERQSSGFYIPIFRTLLINKRRLMCVI